MGQKIHYEENIFFLSDSIRLLERNLPLLPNGEIIREKLVSDIQFIRTGLILTADLLLENVNLLNRIQHIRFLVKSIRSFLSLLTSLRSGQFPISHELLHAIPDFSKIISELQDSLSRVEAALFSIHELDATDQISAEEFQYLFMDNGNEEAEM